MMNRAVGRGRAGFLVGGFMALTGLGLLGCEADNSDYEGGMPVGGSSASLGLAPDGRCAEVYTHVERFREDGSLWATVDIHRDGAGLGGTVQLDGEAEAWTISGWDRQALLSPEGKVLDYAYTSRMELLDEAGAVKATAFFFSRHAEGNPDLQDNMELRVGPAGAVTWEDTFAAGSVDIGLLPGSVERGRLLDGDRKDCL